jgi:hypothetical protein
MAFTSGIEATTDFGNLPNGQAAAHFPGRSTHFRPDIRPGRVNNLGSLRRFATL